MTDYPSPQALSRELKKYRRATNVLRRNNGRGTVSHCCLGVYRKMCADRGLKIKSLNDGAELDEKSLPKGHWLTTIRMHQLMKLNDNAEGTKGEWMPESGRGVRAELIEIQKTETSLARRRAAWKP